MEIPHGAQYWPRNRQRCDVSLSGDGAGAARPVSARVPRQRLYVRRPAARPGGRRFSRCRAVHAGICAHHAGAGRPVSVGPAGPGCGGAHRCTGGGARLPRRSRLGGCGHVWRGRARPPAHRAHRHIGAAHPAAFRGDLATSYERHKGIWHAYFFQMPNAEQVVAANDFAFLEDWWRDASPEYDPTPVIERVKATFRQPGVVTAALSYYRHTFHPANRDPALQSLQERIGFDPHAGPDARRARHQRSARTARGLRGHGRSLPEGPREVRCPGRRPLRSRGTP